MGDECVVTGGRGFAARHLVLQLLASGRWRVVRILDLAPTITLDPYEASGILAQYLASGRAQYISADLRDPSQVTAACRGALAVFHMAAPDSSINNFDLHYSVSVEGTRNIINACHHNNVRKLIYTSSPSTVFDGIHGIVNGDESMPYPGKHNDYYSETKAQGEALVLAANGKSGLVTCALRPSSIFGPGDKLLVPSLVAHAKAGKMKFVVGDGKNMYDFTYVENVAHAHVCAEQALDPANCDGDNVAAGKAYFITNREPKRFWDFCSEILEGLGYERPKVHVPVKLLMPLAYVVEWTYQHLPISRASPPQFTPSRLRLITSWRTFNCDRAVKLLGYNPIVSLEDGMKKTIESFSHLRAEPNSVSRGIGSTSKAHKFLGGGKVADLMLWKDMKMTFAVALAVLTSIYFLFISCITVLSATSKLCLVLTAVAYFHNFVPSSLLGSKIQDLFPSAFELSQDTMNTASLFVRRTWNSLWDIIEEAIAKRNIVAFIKIMIFAYGLKVLGKFPFSTVLLAGFALLFIVFYIYDLKEAEIDDFLSAMKIQLEKCQASLRCSN